MIEMGDEKTAGRLPATYSNNLDLILSAALGTDQGGQIKASFKGVGLYLSRLRAASYNFLASEIQKAIGKDAAEQLFKKAVRRYGRYRGEKIRRLLERAGLPRDVEHLSKWWDIPTDLKAGPTEYFADKDPQRNYTAYEPHLDWHSTLFCGLNDNWMRVCREVEKLDIIHCEEVHRGVAGEVNPDIEVWYPSILSRGQGHCEFRFTMPMESAFKAREIAEQYREEAKKDERAGDLLPIGSRAPYRANATPAMAYEFSGQSLALQYHFITDSLINLEGFNAAYAITEEALRRWGENRGLEMREDHLRRGWELNVENFIKYHDDPSAGDAWIAENVMLTPEEHTRVVTKSLFANTKRRWLLIIRLLRSLYRGS
jgi:hypothetical protein